MYYGPIIRNKRAKLLIIVAVILVFFHRPMPESVTLNVGSIAQVSDSPRVEPVVINDQRAEKLDQIVQPIITVTEFVDGQKERNQGSGFIAGDRFYTVQHNLDTAFPSLKIKSTSYINNFSIQHPVFVSQKQDVAVFELSDELCARYCNQAEISYSPQFTADRKVHWLRKHQDDLVLKEASILKRVVFGDTNNSSSMSCDQDQVVLIDRPFIPGSSGAPVMDNETGKIIGIIQGSVGDEGEAKGYFKPINCVLAMLSEPGTPPQSLAKL